MSQRQGRAPSKKRSRRSSSSGSTGLEAKVAETGGRVGYGLEANDPRDVTTRKEGAGVYGSRASVASASKAPRRRLFLQAHSNKSSGTQTNGTSKGVRGDASTIKSGAPSNPYSSSSNRRPMTSSASTVATRTTKASTLPKAAGLRSGVEHIVCAISENLAKETCVTSLDAGSPTSLLITKQGNGQTYAETLAYLEVLQPDEILLNEGRRNSQLAKKVLALYRQTENTDNPIDVDRNRRRGNKRKSRQGRHFATSAFDREPSRRDTVDSDEDNEDAVQPGGAFSGPCNTCTVVKFVPRSYFDQTKGAELLQRIARSDTYDPSLMEEYILLSSAHAALLYTQLCLGANFAKKSIYLNVNAGGNNRMNIDRSSLVHLELLANAKTGKMANSLIGTIDCTKTTVGSRLLRTNLMAPPMQVETIHTRLDLVDSFLGDEEFFYTVMDHLQALPDVDKMLINVALVPWKRGNKQGETRVTARVASKGISALVCIKSILGAMPAFAGALEEQLAKLNDRERVVQHQSRNHARMDDNVSTVTDGSLLIGLGSCGPGSTPSSGLRNQLLGAIVKTMKHSALPNVMNAILEIFVESTTFSRNAHAMRHQEAFALKPKTDGMMDLIRKAFLANVDDIYRLADEYAEEYGVKVSVKETTSRGYYLALPADAASDLPQIFIQPVKSGRFIHCTTEEVHSLNARAQENVQDLLMMTHERIQEVLDFARDHYDALASLSDAIALLDLCHCFADNVASSRDRWCRPIVSDSAGHAGREICIRNGRYGIDTSNAGLSLDAGTFVPNDTHASRSRHFTVITGVNGSGKSTYLKQIAIIVVLAHCGSYVPADEARIPVRFVTARLYVRMSKFMYATDFQASCILCRYRFEIDCVPESEQQMIKCTIFRRSCLK
jgi:DNA mismatch repair protein MSH4